MRVLRSLLLLGLLAIPAAFAYSQVAVGIGVGPVVAPIGYDGYAYGPPVCSYGYYPYYPYACAPYGYYGPSWFLGGVFIGAGPWYHGYYGHPWGWGYGRVGWGSGYGYRGGGFYGGRPGFGTPGGIHPTPYAGGRAGFGATNGYRSTGFSNGFRGTTGYSGVSGYHGTPGSSGGVRS